MSRGEVIDSLWNSREGRVSCLVCLLVRSKDGSWSETTQLAVVMIASSTSHCFGDQSGHVNSFW